MGACLHEVAVLHDARDSKGGCCLAHGTHHDVVDDLQADDVRPVIAAVVQEMRRAWASLTSGW